MVVAPNEELSHSLVPTLAAANAADLTPLGATSTGSFLANSVRFEVGVASGVTDGIYTPAITWSDAVGNTTEAATFTTPAIEVLAAAITLQVRQEAVALLRSPTGNASAEAPFPIGPYFALTPPDPLSAAASMPGDTFSLDRSGETLAPELLLVWADPEKSRLLGTARRNESGEWSWIELAFDSDAAFVSALDDVGNETPVVRIEKNEWVATSNTPSFVDNPNAAARVAAVAPTLRQEGTGVTTALGGTDGSTVTSSYRRALEPLESNRRTAARPHRLRHGVRYGAWTGRALRRPAPQCFHLLSRHVGMGRPALVQDGAGRRYPACPIVPRHGLRQRAWPGQLSAESYSTTYMTYFNDFWEWDGVRWARVTPSRATPRRARTRRSATTGTAAVWCSMAAMPARA